LAGDLAGSSPSGLITIGFLAVCALIGANLLSVVVVSARNQALYDPPER